MELRDINYKGAALNVILKGNMQNKPVVFLHGNSLSSDTFKKQAEQLAMPFVMIDLPGHGQSKPAADPESIYSIPGYANAVAHVIDQLQLDNFIIAGHSLGGHIAINVAASVKGLKGLLVFGTPPLDSVASIGNAFLPNPLFPLLLQGTLTKDEALSLAGSMLNEKQHDHCLKNNILATDPSARSHFGASVGKGMVNDEVKIVRGFNFPVAILHGKNDSYINKQYIEGLNFSNLWENKVHVVENSGHVPQLENPQSFNSLLTSYYQSVLK
ncbi:MAG: alpha/beta fold hydrolase [Bacteroidia bacterium]